MKKAKLKRKLRAARWTIRHLKVWADVRDAARSEESQTVATVPPALNAEPVPSAGEVAWIEEVIAKEIFDTTPEKVTGPGAQAAVKRAALLIARGPHRLSEVPLSAIAVEVALRAATTSNREHSWGLMDAAREIKLVAGVSLDQLCPLCAEPDPAISEDRHRHAFHAGPE